jgi:ubiquinone biosynthesis protein COQ4
MPMAEIPYLMRGIRPIATESSMLVSSSRYLNDPRLRDWIATHMLRRSGRDRPSPSDSLILSQLLQEIQDLDRIEALFTAERKRNQDLDRWFSAGFTSTFTKEDLRHYPPGSIGHRFHTYLTERNFEVDLVARWEPKTQYDYFRLRSAQTHDLEHIIGGAGFDYVGELVPYYMRLTNLFKHLDAELAGETSVQHILGSTRIMSRAILHYPQTWPTVLETIERGAKVGRLSAPIFMMRYEDVLHLTPEEGRAVLGVHGVEEVDTSAASAIWEEIVPPA